jgi:hypothetical protein
MEYSTEESVGGFLLFILATVGLICSSLTLYIIYHLNNWNGYSLLVFILTAFQLLYNFSFYFIFLDLQFFMDELSHVIFISFFKFFSVFSSCFITLWINYISYILYYTLTYLKSYNTKQQYQKMFFCNLLFSFFFAVLVVTVYNINNQIVSIEYLYYWIRVISILFNLYIYVYTSFQLHDEYYQNMTFREFCCCLTTRKDLNSRRTISNLFLSAVNKEKTTVSLSPSAAENSNQRNGKEETDLKQQVGAFNENNQKKPSVSSPVTKKTDYFPSLRLQTKDLLVILAARLKYYPLVQIITLVGTAWWEFEYGFHLSSLDGNTQFSVSKSFSFYLFCICAPSASIGYFIVFLLVHPLAWKRFQRMIYVFLKYFKCYFCCLFCLKFCCCKIETLINDEKKRRNNDRSEDTFTTEDGDDHHSNDNCLTTKSMFVTASRRPTEDIVASSSSSGSGHVESDAASPLHITPHLAAQSKGPVVNETVPRKSSLHLMENGQLLPENSQDTEAAIDEVQESPMKEEAIESKDSNKILRHSSGAFQLTAHTSTGSTVQKFTIERDSELLLIQNRLSFMTEDALWEEIEKRRHLGNTRKSSLEGCEAELPV